LGERFPVNVLHYDAGLTVELKKIIECRNVLMMQARLYARFIMKSRYEAGAGNRLSQDLNRDNPANLGVHCAVYLAHASRTDVIHQAVITD
jgi:hypothetical protein